VPRASSAATNRRAASGLAPRGLIATRGASAPGSPRRPCRRAGGSTGLARPSRRTRGETMALQQGWPNCTRTASRSFGTCSSGIARFHRSVRAASPTVARSGRPEQVLLEDQQLRLDGGDPRGERREVRKHAEVVDDANHSAGRRSSVASRASSSRPRSRVLQPRIASSTTRKAVSRLRRSKASIRRSLNRRNSLEGGAASGRARRDARRAGPEHDRGTSQGSSGRRPPVSPSSGLPCAARGRLLPGSQRIGERHDLRRQLVMASP